MRYIITCLRIIGLSFCFYVCHTHITTCFANIKALSHITVTSNKATCTPLKTEKNIEKNIYVFRYLDNVRVTFADKSHVTSDALEIMYDSKNSQKHDPKNNLSGNKSHNDLSQFKKITFTGNVFVQKKENSVNADQAELFLKENICKFTGNVKVIKTKDNKNDVPIEMHSQEATLNFKTDHVLLTGNSYKPVCTKINLENHPALQVKKKKTKNKKKKRK